MICEFMAEEQVEIFSINSVECKSIFNIAEVTSLYMYAVAITCSSKQY